MSIEDDDIRVSRPEPMEGEKVLDRTLRPVAFDDFIGQESVKEQLTIAIEAAKMRGEAIEHILLYGPPGLGKTTIANIVANEMAVSLRTTSGPVLEKRGDMAAQLTNLDTNNVLFIDEIHRMPAVVEEILYPAMEDFKFDIMLGEGPNANSIRMDLQPFTLIGATTRAGMLTSPLRERFGIIQRLDYYDAASLKHILLRSSRKLGILIEDDAALEIANRARGTPRIANRLMRRVRDYAQVKADGNVNIAIAREALQMHQIDESGLNLIDTRYLQTVIDKFKGGPVGLETIAAAIGEESNTIEDVVEPYLIKEGFLMRTPRGRVATDNTLQHFGKIKPRTDRASPDLFKPEESTDD